MEYQAYKKIPNLLRKYRRINHLQQKEVVVRLGLKSNGRVSNWEIGRVFPGIINAIKLSVIYKTSLDELFKDHRSVIIEEIQTERNKRGK